MGLYDYKTLNLEVKNFLPKKDFNDELSNSILQNWTEQAVECYSLKCNCTQCSIHTNGYSFICQMPFVVKRLLKKLGKPTRFNCAS